MTESPAIPAAPASLCRYHIGTAEGERFEIELTLADSSSFSYCCDTGLRKFMRYSWSVSVNGVALEWVGQMFRLPSALEVEGALNAMTSGR